MLLSDLDTLFDVLVGEDRLPPPGFKRRPVRFVVELDDDGALTGVTDTTGDRFEALVPDIGRSGSSPEALPVIDNGKFVLAIPKTTSTNDEAAAVRAQAAYLDRLRQLRTAVDDLPELARAVDAIVRFATDPAEARKAIEARLGAAFQPNAKNEYVEANDRFRFRVSGSDPTEHQAVREWWAEQIEGTLGSGRTGICQVTGDTTEIARITPRISLRQGKEALISANFAAAERYDASQSSGAQMGVRAAIRSHQALNWLLDQRNHHRRIGEATFVWWLAGDLEFDPFSNVIDPDPDMVAAQLASPWTGRAGVTPNDLFRLLVVSLTEARVVIRTDHTLTLGELESRLGRWFELVDSPGKHGRWYPSLPRLASAAVGRGEGTARKAQRDRIISALAEAAITGTPLPTKVLNAVVGRCRAESSVTATRAALLRLCRSLKENRMSGTESAGMLCGRLLAQLESAQHAALGEVNRTIVDRYYAAASATPERVFPALLRGAQAHLSKAGRRSKGAQVLISRRLGELATSLAAAGGIPPTLTTAGQADFALGYWQERQARFDRKIHEENSEEQP
jgi:CRISPR-associated protein Csd1